MKIIKVSRDLDKKKLVKEYLDRTDNPDPEIESAVAEIIRSVKQYGDESLRYYTKGFDRVEIEDFRVSESELNEAVSIVGEDFINVLKRAYKNIYEFHSKQLESTWFNDFRPGVKLGQKITPIERVGIYVPGGTAGYPSTVLMTAIPAVVAGVGSIAMVSPPNDKGKIDPYILAAAYVCGVKEIYKVGGAQAIAALAYGTESIEAVNKIVGPGNIFVATAKKQVFGTVGIDMIAGPSEIGILADKNANPSYIAADLLSQAEHDTKAAPVLVTDDFEFAELVVKEVGIIKDELSRNEIIEQSLKNYGTIFVTESKEESIELMNIVAPEHLEILWDNAEDYIDSIVNAGAIFLGQYTPEPLGDYFAGPNHTLPTGGTARFSSPLGVYDYIKRSSLISYNREALMKEADDIMQFAKNERLTAHAKSIELRTK
ncbi:histidinol dehydrogenase [Microaceticoccus formicicus]|uniref:histidinol dehydrogenase n=1 Tax=Microaceticoccus formicicus TaxID=3118105 RepID=UPI003CD0468D|nr:histidinol dehydrogenase [Peptoniphilaceae bacterium AMB_02]